jgi:hypothetical protein
MYFILINQKFYSFMKKLETETITNYENYELRFVANSKKSEVLSYKK